ncbi:MAG: hypothetical protein KGL39_57155 [Patescibacteria group bacterium]|nr:hypothetical protein [Patescibacteria group bacterium]
MRFIGRFIVALLLSIAFAGGAGAYSAYPSYYDAKYPTRASLSTLTKAQALTGTYKHVCIAETGYAGCYDAIADSTATVDGVTVLAFSDAPATGRWIRSSTSLGAMTGVVPQANGGLGVTAPNSILWPGGIVANGNTLSSECKGRVATECGDVSGGSALSSLVNEVDNTVSETAWENRGLKHGGTATNPADYCESMSISTIKQVSANPLTDYYRTRFNTTYGDGTICDQVDIWMIAWGNRGVSIFPFDTDTPPGTDHFQINGALQVIGGSASHNTYASIVCCYVNFIAGNDGVSPIDGTILVQRDSNAVSEGFRFTTGLPASLVSDWFIGETNGNSNFVVQNYGLAAAGLSINNATNAVTVASLVNNGTLTYGGVTLSAGTTGTGNLVAGTGPTISAPTLTGVVTFTSTFYVGSDALVRLGTLSSTESFIQAYQADKTTAAQLDVYVGSTKQAAFPTAGGFNLITGVYQANGTAGVTSATCTQWTAGICTHS